MHRAEDAAFLGCATEARVGSKRPSYAVADCRLPIADCRLQGLPPALDKVGWHSALRRIDPYQFSRKI
jgi:hypothetical protein